MSGVDRTRSPASRQGLPQPARQREVPPTNIYPKKLLICPRTSTNEICPPIFQLSKYVPSCYTSSRYAPSYSPFLFPLVFPFLFSLLFPLYSPSDIPISIPISFPPLAYTWIP